ncbi:glycosyltransferase family 2 protein [Patescibacteria group bacterium]|nr:glycosyltransferase family 2 protein [Patescibacteria group bacterium]
MSKRPTISLLIPCLNEKKTIARAVADAKKNAKKFFPKDWEIVVADNGSTDGSWEILKKIKEIRVINVPIKGYGAALHWGIMKSRGEFVVFADADLSYPFKNLKKFKNTIEEKPDLVLGSRLRGTISRGAMPILHRYLGTPVLTFLIRIAYRIPTSDCNSGMRMVKKSFYKLLNMKSAGMEWASELLLKTAIKHGKYMEVPIYFYKDKRGRPPHLARWADGWRHLKAILLLKPIFLVLTMLLFLVLAFISLPYSFGFTSFFLLFFFVVFLSLLALEYFSFAIEGKPNLISTFLNSVPLVPITIFLLFFTILIILFLPDEHLGTKILLSSIDAITFIWVFLIETIKTHLVNRLPDLK